MSNSKISFVTYKFNIFGGKLKPNEISHKCLMLYPIPATTNLFKFYSEMRILPIPAAKGVSRKSVLISTR